MTVENIVAKAPKMKVRATRGFVLMSFIEYEVQALLCPHRFSQYTIDPHWSMHGSKNSKKRAKRPTTD